MVVVIVKVAPLLATGAERFARIARCVTVGRKFSPFSRGNQSGWTEEDLF
jgi:hypothetical protein